MISRIRYVFREMWASLSRNKTLTFASVITAAVSLFMAGMGFLVQRGFDNQLSEWSGGVEMIVYVEHGHVDGDPEVELIRQELESLDTVVESVVYCDEACATKEANVLFAGDPDTLEQLMPKIPSNFKVKPIDKDSGEVLRSLGDSFSQLPNVIDVQTPDEAVETLGQLRGIIGVWVFGLSILLLLVSVVLIWNTIRTAMFARRREIEVMKLVGATNWFIRLPFMLEGLLQGLVGGFTGGLLMLVTNNSWTDAVRGFDPDSGLAAMVVTDGYPITVWVGMMLFGGLVGAVGSLLAASKFLDV